MGKYQIEQIKNIVIQNQNKGLIDAGKKQADKLMLHLHGVGMEGALNRFDYFENPDLYAERKKYTISNKDLFGRLLQQEDMIFTANGGCSYFGLPDAEEAKMNALISDVRYEMPLRKWMRNFALQAYRADPMGIIFMEVETLTLVDDQPVNTPKTYPTYKSIYSIYDYQPNGRKLEYVCFRLTVGEAKSFGVQDVKLRDRDNSDLSDYYRFVDDEKDVVVFREGENVTEATNMQQNPVKNPWGKCPAFVLSDLVQFNNPNLFVSPLDLVVELSDCFLNDRSVRDLQKKYHGFSKAVEPLVQCATCEGHGMLGGDPCPDCTPAGYKKGTGKKLKTKVSDVTKFPLEMFSEGSGFDFHKVFGYVTPDIEGWNKQDLSLSELEDTIHRTYWGTSNQTAQQTQKTQNGEQRTATEVSLNNAPREARLNMTADWAESTEALIADFIGQFWFDGFTSSNIAYGRNYVLETPDELIVKYQDMRTNGAPEPVLDDMLSKYFNALYQNNPVQLTICTKLMNLEPFVHLTVAQCEPLVESELDYVKKLYFGEWRRKAVTPDQILKLKPEQLDLMLEEYATEKYQKVQKDRDAQALREQQAATAMQNIKVGARVQNAA
jgi:hypothetical protein